MGARAARAHLHLYPPPRAPANNRPGFPLGFLVLLAGGRLPMAWPIGMAGIPLFAHAGLKKRLRRPSPALLKAPGFGRKNTAAKNVYVRLLSAAPRWCSSPNKQKDKESPWESRTAVRVLQFSVFYFCCFWQKLIHRL